MANYKIVESVGSSTQNIHSYSDIEHHHPSKHLHEAGRVYATVDGKREEVAGDYNGNIIRTQNGNLMVSKDLVLLNNNSGSSSVPVPAPASGYVGGIDKRNGVVEIFDKPGGEIIARIRHMDLSNFNLKNGDQIQYGQPMGTQSGFGKGNPNAFGTHTHIDYNVQYLDQLKKYITDIDKGIITTDKYPQQTGNLTSPTPTVQASPLADGVLKQGERGPEVTALQNQLNTLGFKDAQGRALVPDADFGNSTKQAVEAFQRSRNLVDDGVVGKDTFAALKQNAPVTQVPAANATVPVATLGGTTALSNLIGRGEGDYNSYNRGNAGDAGKPLNLTDMTVGEIIRRQHLPHNDPSYLFAVGKFQMVGPPADTMSETVRALGINSNTKFTPDLQERMFANYLIDGKRPAVNAYITGKSSGPEGLEKAQHALALEFASVGDPRKGGRGAYDGDSAGNSASIKVSETATALNQMRTQYQANIGRGLSPDAAYDALRGQAPTQGTTSPTQGNTPTQTGALADGVLKQGEKGPEVKHLQEQLIKSGITTINGRPFVADTDFGPNTKAAVEQYQRTHNLSVDGVAGKETLTALNKGAPTQTNPTTPSTQTTTPSTPPVVKADQSPLLSNPNHPEHALYKQALVGLEKLPASTFKNEQERQNAAASVAFEAKVTGLTKIDNVALSTNGSGLFAVQGAMNDPAHQRVYVDKAQAAAQPIEKSTQQIQQDVQLAQPTQQDQQKKSGILIA